MNNWVFLTVIYGDESRFHHKLQADAPNARCPTIKDLYMIQRHRTGYIILLTFDLKLKFTNKQYILLNLLEAPVLAFFIFIDLKSGFIIFNYNL